MIVPAPTPEPSTLAVARLGGDGAADYTFSLAGTSALGSSRPGDLPPGLAAGTDALVLGGLALLMEPIASTLSGMLSDSRATASWCLTRTAARRRRRTPARIAARSAELRAGRSREGERR